MDEALLSRIEDAGLNASAPPQQRWLDGWLLRFSPGKAKRARCINALALGRLPPAQRLRLALEVYAQAGLPALMRITPFTQPKGLENWLADEGWTELDDTRVMVNTRPATVELPPLPPGTGWHALDANAYAETVGALRDSPTGQRLAHAARLASSPVPYRGFAIRRADDGTVLACGQFAREADLVGLYDIHTHPLARRQGLATYLCKRLLSIAAKEGAALGYLQVEPANDAARRIYRRLGFADAYAYHYRQAP